MNCSLNWSFIGCGELHCDSVKIKTMINPSLFFLRQCEFLDWNDCLVVLLSSATHFGRVVTRVWLGGVSHFHSVFGKAFSLLSPRPLPAPFDSPPSPPSSLREVSTWRFREQIARSKKTPTVQANSLRIYLQLSRLCFFLVWLRKFYLLLPGLQKQSRIGLKSEKYCPRGKIMFSQYAGMSLFVKHVADKQHFPVFLWLYGRHCHA